MEGFKNMFNSKLYNSKYHDIDISKSNFLITGGAGFIGSNIVEYLIKYNAGKVRVLDNLSNGYYENIKDFIPLSNFEFIEGDIRSIETCKNAILNVDYVCHQAALGSVPRSITDPILTNEVNISGFLNMLNEVKNSTSVKKFVYAASSSTYGDSKELPKIEGKEGDVLSPYAVTKLVNELYANVFSKVYDFQSIGLRYFNVFGPKQNPNNPYAAVIPIFCQNFLENKTIKIFGDGLTSRDFTFIENVVQANIKAFFCQNFDNHEVFNVACGDQTSLTEVIDILNEISSSQKKPIFEQNRKGDIKHSKADISKIKKYLEYQPLVDFENGLKITYDWYKTNHLKNL
jgi:UDP-N-acetylglucosamine/UDP-N-acetylgalactosamine 4-epimerase